MKSEMLTPTKTEVESHVYQSMPEGKDLELSYRYIQRVQFKAATYGYQRSECADTG